MSREVDSGYAWQDESAIFHTLERNQNGTYSAIGSVFVRVVINGETYEADRCDVRFRLRKPKKDTRA